MIDYTECVRIGLLKQIAPSDLQAEEQFKKANVLLEEAQAALKAELPNTATMGAYSAALDASRALLFRDGWRERSHACTARYLEENYLNEIGADDIALLDHYRDARHKTMYSSEYYPTKEEAARVVKFAEGFILKIGKMRKK